MIRLREENYPPVYQLELALKLLRNGNANEEVSKVLKAEPLHSVANAELNVEHSVSRDESIISVTDTRIKLKVVYKDALEEYQTADDELWSSEAFGIYRYHVRDLFTEWPYSRMDMMEMDKRYHQFDYIRDLGIYQFDDTQEVTLVWFDIETEKTYCTHVAPVILNT